MLFGTIRKSAYFRTDINTLLDRIVGCLRDSIAAGGGPASPYAAIVDDPCYSAADVPPLGYYPNYKEMLFLAAPGGGVNANGDATCAGALLFASQRDSQTLRCPVATPTAAQQRSSPATRGDVCNYLEEINLASYQAAGVDFSGPELFAPVSAEQTAFRDIVRCIPNSPSFVAPTTVVPGLAGPLASYSPTTRTLTLGQTTPTSLSSTVASALSSCAWVPETHSLGAGLRSYFSFRINDAGFTSATAEGFTFAIVDGDNNDLNACGAAAQHIGYSGNNLLTPFIAPPKIGFEIDPKREGGFNPASSNTLTTGRNDPPTSGYAYRGGHVAIVYWGGETSIDTGLTPPCTAPRIDVGGRCYLPQEEDDNVHAQPASARSGFPPPPANPAAPIPPLSVPPDAPAGVYKLDPNRSQVPVNQDFHVRVELNRAPAAYALPTVRAASTGNLNLAAPGASIDGIRLFNGDRVLVKDQSVAGENGIYVWRGALTAMARATDADSAVELAGLLIEVQQGTQARSIWRQKETHPTLGADPLRWANSRVKVATRTDLDLTTPGVSIDGIRMAAGDRVLVKAQSIAADNGIYLWNGSASLMTRASDADTATELTGLVVQVQQGEDATAWWRFDGAIWSRLAVKVASQANLDLAAPGPSIDGVALTAGDRVLVKAQGSAAQNGIYIWNGAASPLTRATDADAATELAGLLTQVQAGTDTGRAFRQSSLAYGGTLGTGAVQWTAIDPSPSFLLEIWILPDSPTDANRIAAMKNTTRPMSLLSPGFTPHLRDAPIIGYPFRNARIGFTLGQRTTRNDQTFSISDITTSWLP
jgi:translation initiation factor IF-1